MIELLEGAADLHPEQPAVVRGERTVTYAELRELARAAADGLRARDIARFGIVDVDAARVTALLAGSAAVGAEACVYPPVDDPQQVTELAERFDHDWIITDRGDLTGSFTTLTLEGLTAARPAPSGRPGEPPAVRPLLMFTTGTTGHPRGVRQEWSRVLRTTARLKPAADQRWLLAYGLQQFGGLQVLLHVLAAGATLVAPVPRRPREGLAAMRAHGVTHVSATPTFWRFVLAEMRSDGGPVPDLRQITLGGEAVPDRLLDELTATFPSAKVSQIYGSTESGNPRATRDGRKGLPLSALTDDPAAEIALKIVDGELWVRSRVGMVGYYGDPEGDPDAWRSTGDLVEVEGDRILFRGRKSEIINVGGVKVSPFPVEERVMNVAGVDVARVFGRPNALTGSIVAVEVLLSAGSDEDATVAAIRAACADLPPAARPRSVVVVEEIRTQGNKIHRGAS